MGRKKVLDEVDRALLDIEEKVAVESSKAVLKEVAKTAVNETKETIKTWYEVGKLIGSELVKRARNMGFEDPAEYLKSALDFYDYYRDKIASLEEQIKELKAENAMLAHLKPKILLAWAVREFKKLEKLHLFGLIDRETYLQSLKLIRNIVESSGDGYGREE